MVSDLGVVLLASRWFFDCFKHTGKGGDAGLNPLDTDELARCAGVQSSAFDDLATNVLAWFPEGSNMHATAAECADRMQNVANDLSIFVGDVTAWYEASIACSALSESLRQITIGGKPLIPNAGFVRPELTMLENMKAYEVQAHWNAMTARYPWAMHVFQRGLDEQAHDNDTEGYASSGESCGHTYVGESPVSEGMPPLLTRMVELSLEK